MLALVQDEQHVAVDRRPRKLPLHDGRSCRSGSSLLPTHKSKFPLSSSSRDENLGPANSCIDDDDLDYCEPNCGSVAKRVVQGCVLSAQQERELAMQETGPAILPACLDDDDLDYCEPTCASVALRVTPGCMLSAQQERELVMWRVMQGTGPANLPACLDEDDLDYCEPTCTSVALRVTPGCMLSAQQERELAMWRAMHETSQSEI